ncbi:MAG: hypothetical protein ACKOXK_08700 [Chakrabartia sp.]
MQLHAPEDICICHTNRPLLEQRYGIRFAPLDVAARFSFERGPSGPSLGFHGLFNFPALFPESWGGDVARLPQLRLCNQDAWDLGARLIADRLSGRWLYLSRIAVATLRYRPAAVPQMLWRWIKATI